MNKEKIRQRISDLETALQNPNLPQEQKTKIENELYGLREIERNIFAQELEVAAKKQTSGTSSALTGIIGLPMAFFFRKKPKVIEEEKEYQKIAKELKTPFAKKNGKEFYDCLYGSLDDPNTPSLHQNTMNQIKKYGALYENYAKDKENPELKPYKNYKKYRDLIAKYSKKDKAIHKKNQDDPVVARTKLQIQEEVENRFGEAKNSPTTGKYISTVLEPKRWEEFVQRYPEKAKAYAEQDAQIKKAYEKRLSEQELKNVAPSSVENKLHRPPDISQQEVEQRLKAATKQGEDRLSSSANKFGLAGSRGRPLTNAQQTSRQQEREEERKTSIDVYKQYQNWQARFNKLQKWWKEGGGQSARRFATNTRGFVNKGFSRASTKIVNVGNKLFSSLGGRLGGIFGGGAGGGAAAGGGATATAGGGAVVAGGGAAAGGVIVTGGGSAAVGAGISAPVWGGIALAVAAVIIIFIVIFQLTGGFEAKPETEGGSTTGLSCLYTRSGNSAPYKSSILLGWINSTASKNGVPAPVIASVARHENPDFTTNADDYHDGIKNNYFYYIDPSGTTRAVGLMQLSVGKTPTSSGVVDYCTTLLNTGVLKKAADKLGKKIQNQEYYCVKDVDERAKRFCQTDYLVLGKNLYAPPDNKADQSFINLCQLTDNLMVGTELLNNKISSGNWQIETDVKKAIEGYYGACKYPGGNYCDEVWYDLENCKPTTGVPGKTTSSLDWTGKIVNNLNVGLWGFYNVLPENITNGSFSTGIWTGVNEDTIYWCTYLVIDSYNLAGVSGLSKSNHASVVNMRYFWSNNTSSNYKYLDYSGSLLNLPIQPGYAMFMESIAGVHMGLEHVAIIKNVSIDSRGNGTIEVYHSNYPTKINKYIVSGWILQNTLYPVRGFGGIKD